MTPTLGLLKRATEGQGAEKPKSRSGAPIRVTESAVPTDPKAFAASIRSRTLATIAWLNFTSCGVLAKALPEAVTTGATPGAAWPSRARRPTT